MFLHFSLIFISTLTVLAAVLAVLCIAKRKLPPVKTPHITTTQVNSEEATYHCLPFCFRFWNRNEKSSEKHTLEYINSRNNISPGAHCLNRTTHPGVMQPHTLELHSPNSLGLEVIQPPCDLRASQIFKPFTADMDEHKSYPMDMFGLSGQGAGNRKRKYTRTRASGTLCASSRRRYYTNRILIDRHRNYLRKRLKYRLIHKQTGEMVDSLGKFPPPADFRTLEIWSYTKPADAFESPWVKTRDGRDDKSCVSRHTNSSLSSFGTSLAMNLSPKAKDACNIIADLYVPQQRIILEKLVLEGTFGRLYMGRIRRKANKRKARPERWEKALVKSVSDQATDEQIQVLLQNACDIVGLVHKNIACLVGTSYTGSEKQSSSPNLSRSKPLLIYPYAEYGNLKQYLRSTSFGCPDQHTGLGFTARNLVTMGLQIIKALEFLHGRKIVHKDVAARNCMLGRNFRVLLSDAALSRDLFPEDYQCLGDNTNRPIKWLALEALVERKYTSSTDIWAAGVTLWELVTKCQQPYDSLDAFEMLHILRAGYRMCQPPNCPDDLWTIITTCWKMPPNCRPDSKQLINDLEGFQQAVNNYL
ncbi:hypothetical protein CRM22_007847 [Opisthorchis felineus]|uniref:Protein kinase domain-containing protein n=1 Tax=Opisthorchis felineus TaxID=147828 RepID=A0A4V3SDS0_OPIFE|nr:hypothetical protein CRM22_007847 [Opisthorchis felineus]